MYGNIELPGMCDWCFEEDTGWFVAYSVNVLFKYNRKTKELAAVSAIPTSKAGSFQNPLCVKYKNLIYCIPHYQSSIWYYNLTSDQWKEIILCNDRNVAVMACLLGEYKKTYYFFSMVLKKIFGLDLEMGKVVSSYDIATYEKEDNYYCFNSILVEDCVYIVLGGKNIYEFNLKTLQQESYELNNLNDILYKIGYDKNSFWLIGKKKAVYRWKRGENTVQVLSDFPENFGLYDFSQKLEVMNKESNENDLFVFNGISCLHGKVWLIPQSGSKILYYDKKDNEFRIFEIQNEEETTETLDLHYRHIAAKFFRMYVREERYLGIYSYQNKRMFEIDTQYMKYKNIDVMMDDKSLFNIEIQDFYEDGNESTYLIYNAKMGNRKVDANDCGDRSVGARIYAEIK